MAHNKNKGGAPRKEVTQDKEIKFSCTSEVYAFLIEQSHTAGYATARRSNVAAFLRDFLITMINDGRYQVIKPSEISVEMLKQLIAIGINLNQAMHAVNKYQSDTELVNLMSEITVTRNLLCALATSITSPQKFNKTVQGESS
jgi:hypothetical protein